MSTLPLMFKNNNLDIIPDTTLLLNSVDKGQF